MNAEAAVQPSNVPPRALRLTFRYSGMKAELTARQPVDMTVPPSEPKVLEGDRWGSWIELRDAKNRVLYQQILHDPLPVDAEAPGEPDQGQLLRRPIDQPEGVFEVIVPNMAEARTLRLYASRMQAEPEPAAELLRLPMRADPSDAVQP
jgi:hypothetical protein